MSYIDRHVSKLLSNRPRPTLFVVTLASSVLPLLLVGLPLPQRLAAEVEDSYSLRVNPAGLAFVRGHELRAVYAYDAVGLDSHGVGVFGAWDLGPLALGASWERDFAEFDQGALRVGAGFGGGPIALGVGYASIDTPGPGDRIGTWDLGLSWRPAVWLAAGGAIHDLGEDLGRRQYDVSVAVRPWSRWTLAGQWRITEDEDLQFETLDVAVRTEVEVLPGLRLGVGLDGDRDVFGQLGLDFGRFGLGGFGNYVNERAQVGGELVFRGVAANRLVKLGTVAVVDLSGDLVPEPELDLLRGAYRVESYGRIERQLYGLATAEAVNGAFIRIGSLEIGWAKAESLRRALLALRSAGRRVDCALSGGGDLGYYIATACTEILMLPAAILRVDGLARTKLFVGGALGRLGVHFEVERIGAYKNAPDQLSAASASPEERDRVEAFLTEVHARYVKGIAEGRGLSEAEVRAQLDRGVLTATAAVAGRWIDAALYPDQLDQHVLTRYSSPPRFRPAPPPDPASSPRPWAAPSAIGVVHLDAAMTAGRSEASPLGMGRTVGARSLVEALARARRDRRVKAVVLRVDSPGGDAVASDLVARAVEQLAAVKPVVASFGDVAASGGYYAAAPASRIFAEPTTRTGSIGIYAVKLDLSELLSRWGIGVDVARKGARAADGSPYIRRDDAGDAAVAGALAAAYTRFVDTVARGRKLSVDQVRALGAGRVWTGKEAVELGLVDELGGYVEALEHAASLAGMPLGRLEVLTMNQAYQPIANPLQALLSIVGVEGPAPIPLPSAWLTVASWWPLLEGGAPLAMDPTVLSVE